MVQASSPSSESQSHSQTGGKTLEPLFTYIWKNSRRQQIYIIVIVLVSLPFYYLSLDLPRGIVNDAIQGRAFNKGTVEVPLVHIDLELPDFLGGYAFKYTALPLSRMEYLMALSLIFIVLVMINGFFRYVVNMQKGKLGELLLRRLRLDLFNLLLRFSPEAIRSVRSAEVATIIRDEVEPIGGFVGDAFIQPAFLGGQAATALAFIVLQSPLLGLLAGLMVLVQAIIIPRMRREQLRLGRLRQIRSRTLAGQVGEIVDSMAEVSNHNTRGYEGQKITTILNDLFWIRYDLYGRKFMVKFINSTLSQITPFLFYSIGGYFALRGNLDIGQLVAVISAYRDLPPPTKELIDWDQQRLDVQVKYTQIVEQFSLAELPLATGAPPPAIAGSIEIEALRVRSPSGDMLLDGINLTLPLGQHILLTGSRGEGYVAIAQVLARRYSDYSGKVRLAGHDLANLPSRWLGAKLAYLGPDPPVFGGTLRHNLTYSLRRPAPEPPETRSYTDWGDEPDREADVTDERPAAAETSPAIEGELIELLDDTGLAETVFALGLASDLPEDPGADLSSRIVKARLAVIEDLEVSGSAACIEAFDPSSYNHHATIGENIFFGVLRRKASLDTLTDDVVILAFLREDGLFDDILALGLNIAATTCEIFAQVSNDHILFDRFSFISYSDLPRFADIVARAGRMGIPSLGKPDRQALAALAFEYCETHHHLGLLTEAVSAKVLWVRGNLMRAGAGVLKDAIEFYDPGRLCVSASLRDNLLFGRINHAIPGAEQRVSHALHAAVRRYDLDGTVFGLGLDHEVGPKGRTLMVTQRAAIGLVRCLIKRPEILILDQPVLSTSGEEQQRIFSAVRRRMAGRTLLAAMRDPPPGETFDLVVTTAGNRIERSAQAAAGGAPATEEALPEERPEIRALRAVPMFALLDTPRLKLIAITSERVRFSDGQTLFYQDDESDAAYIILSGAVDVFAELPDGRVHLASNPANSIVGEMGLISDAPRSATVIAVGDVVALRLARDVFLNLVAEIPALALEIMREQIARLNKAEQRFRH
ncbi:cyclic nucleotide-binding domain-containing protein [Labrys okinawensis]|uniref:cyclic nucleotide-binding domain-containing protein n=1 Tax=Labrys okinawensis TaxID=346911 RepID=UPI0039BD2ED5